jgi:hypothetical protein
MQITIDIPDNLPQALIDRQIKEFEQKLANLTETTINTKSQKLQAMLQIIKRCESLPIIDPRTPDQILGYEQSPKTDIQTVC